MNTFVQTLLLLYITAFCVSEAFLLEPCNRECFTKTLFSKKLSQADQERLLVSEPALTAFIVAEMRHFLTSKSKEPGRITKWEMSDQEKLDLKLINDDMEIIDSDYEHAIATLTTTMAIDLLCNTTQATFQDGYEQGLLSALGSAILFFKSCYRSSPQDLAACELIGLSDYAVAHHITDMYHHRSFQGAYTKTLAPSGKGEIAARLAVGLETDISSSDAGVGIEEEEEDECLVWSPTTAGVCLHWKSDNEAWRKTRFERVQMEGTRDPRRGGSGTAR